MRRVFVVINNTGIGGTERRLGRLFAHMAAQRKDSVFVLNRDLWARLVAGEVIPRESPRVVRLWTPFTALSRWIRGRRRISFWFGKIDYVLFAAWCVWRYGFGEPRMFHVVLGGVYVVLPLMMLRPAHRVVISVTDPNLSGHVGVKGMLPWFTAALRRAHCVEALTEDIRASLIAEGVDVSRVALATGSVVDTSRFRPAPTKECWVVFAGRLVDEKNPRLFLDSIPAIHTAVPQARFFLLGDGPLKDAIARSIEDLGLREIVTAGFRDDLAPILARGMVFVSLQRRDNYPSQALLEAMAAGMAPVASDVGNTSRLVDDETGIRVAPVPCEVAHAVSSLLVDPGRCARLGAAARRRVVSLHEEARYRWHLEEIHRRVADRLEDGASLSARVSKL
jgi:glycosyltransferase involved in cell wall biosynthesis